MLKHAGVRREIKGDCGMLVPTAEYGNHRTEQENTEDDVTGTSERSARFQNIVKHGGVYNHVNTSVWYS